MSIERARLILSILKAELGAPDPREYHPLESLEGLTFSLLSEKVKHRTYFCTTRELCKLITNNIVLT